MKLKVEKANASSSSEEEDEEDDMESESELPHHKPDVIASENDDSSRQLNEAKPAELVINHVVASDSETNHTIKSEPASDANVPSSNQQLLQSHLREDERSSVDYSPSSNSPVFSGVNLVQQQHTTHSVTIKTTVKAKSIQPVNQMFAEEEEEQQGGSQLKRAKLDSGNLFVNF
jgi:hypothetical protein